MIVYPFREVPAPGEAIAVAPGILWLRMPLPFRLDHINLWLIEDGDGWTLVDTGMADAPAQAAWRQVIDGPLGGRPIRRIIVTHFHSDHAGLAGWLADQFGSVLWMSAGEWQRTKRLAGNVDTAWLGTVQALFHRAGCPQDMIAQTRAIWSSYNKRMSPIPDLDTTIGDGMTVEIGGRHWQAMIGHGHAPEHVSLYCPELDVLIAGDQVLPRISPNVSLLPDNAGDDPLGDFLATTASFRRRLPDSALVLPSHNEPFYGLHFRLDQLAEHHDDRLDETVAVCGQPTTAFSVTGALFDSGLDGLQSSLAVTETLAHLNHLIGLGRVDRRTREDGVWLHANA